jgi:cytochrome c biogenesis protein CcmG/thiol:disulfide interchange protein DsbE
MKRIMIIAAALLMLTTAVHGQSSTQQAPPLTLKSIQGRTMSLSNYKGKVVLLNFWATWCPPCRAEMPDMVRMQREYGARGLQIIGITYPPQTLGEVHRFVRKLRVNYPIAMGTKETKALFDESETLPVTIVIDREGNIRERIEGILLAEEFEQKIKPLLR